MWRGREGRAAKPDRSVLAWVKKGATEKEIAAKLKLAGSTFRKYLAAGRQGDERYKALSDTWTESCKVPDDEVEAALYHKCIGYTATVRKMFKIRRIDVDPKTGKKIGEHEELVPGEEQVYVQADTFAIQFWLANRRRDRWQYRPAPMEQAEDGSTGVVLLPEVQELQQDG